MARLNSTLDDDTDAALERYARAQHRPRASLARELLRGALVQQAAIERRRKLAADCARGRADDGAPGSTPRARTTRSRSTRVFAPAGLAAPSRRRKNAVGFSDPHTPFQCLLHRRT